MQRGEEGWAKKNKRGFLKSRDEGLHCIANDSQDDMEILTHATPCCCKKRLHEVNWTSSSDAPLRRWLNTSMLRSPWEAQIFISQWLTMTDTIIQDAFNFLLQFQTKFLHWFTHSFQVDLMRGRCEMEGSYLFQDVKKFFHLFKAEFDLFCK